MLERVDRVQLVVKDRQAAARTFGDLLGAQAVREEPSGYLGAARLVLARGSSEVELCEPSGPGPVAEHLDSQGEGLMTAGFSTGDLAALEREGLWVHPSALCGLLLGISRTTVGWELSGQPARVARA
jgi:hypothetical protein